MRYPHPGGFRFRLARFFMGRNGPDTLYYLFLGLSLLCIFLGGIFRTHRVLGILFPLLYLIFFGYTLFRLLSRNLIARRRENAAFRRALAALCRPPRRLYLRIRDRKTHVFRKCPSCKSTLRLARIPGAHTVRCPECQRRFDVFVK